VEISKAAAETIYAREGVKVGVSLHAEHSSRSVVKGVAKSVGKNLVSAVSKDAGKTPSKTPSKSSRKRAVEISRAAGSKSRKISRGK
jgi:hypothetical protein